LWQIKRAQDHEAMLYKPNDRPGVILLLNLVLTQQHSKFEMPSTCNGCLDWWQGKSGAKSIFYLLEVAGFFEKHHM
jgi:hypothetical protein